jgi:hypothetical protein
MSSAAKTTQDLWATSVSQPKDNASKPEALPPWDWEKMVRSRARRAAVCQSFSFTLYPIQHLAESTLRLLRMQWNILKNWDLISNARTLTSLVTD